MNIFRERRALRRAVTELHRYIVENLDHAPETVDQYLVDADARTAVRGLGVPRESIRR